jgi:hypothetical protein
MGKHSRHYTDLNPLEGGGSGGGGRSGKSAGRPLDAEFYVPATGAALVTAGMAALGAKNDAKREREAAAEMKRESRDREEPMTAGQKQSMQEAKDEEAYQKRKTAPTTKTEMGKAFAKGGMTASSRADGCATKGKTKGRFV